MALSSTEMRKYVNKYNLRERETWCADLWHPENSADPGGGFYYFLSLNDFPSSAFFSLRDLNGRTY